VDAPLQKRGKKSHAFRIPSHLFDGPPGVDGQISIQLAFIRPDWTLIFADHNVMISFHVMHLRQPCKEEDFYPGSRASFQNFCKFSVLTLKMQLWLRLWSDTHGPVHELEPARYAATLETWRARSISMETDVPIFLEVKDNQRVFNGYGAQEACDMLVGAYLHPCMPTFMVCADSVLFTRLYDALVKYRLNRIKLIKSKTLPLLSSNRPFRFNSHGHKLYLQSVSCSRRYHVKVDQESLDHMHSFGLLNSDAVIHDSGCATGVQSFFILSIFMDNKFLSQLECTYMLYCLSTPS
jgi:hypothetical protein